MDPATAPRAALCFGLLLAILLLSAFPASRAQEFPSSVLSSEDQPSAPNSFLFPTSTFTPSSSTSSSSNSSSPSSSSSSSSPSSSTSQRLSSTRQSGMFPNSNGRQTTINGQTDGSTSKPVNRFKTGPIRRSPPQAQPSPNPTPNPSPRPSPNPSPKPVPSPRPKPPTVPTPQPTIPYPVPPGGGVWSGPGRGAEYLVKLPPLAPRQQFNVRRFGAMGNGAKDDTRAFAAAFAAACSFGRARNVATAVVVPYGWYSVTYLEMEGPCGPRMVFKLDGVILGPAGPFVAPVRAAVVSFSSIPWLIVSGRGAIDGRGANWWRMWEAGQLKVDRPMLMTVYRCNNSVIQGITLRNPGTIHLKISRTIGSVVINVTTTSPANSPNTDSIHISASRGVTVKRCTLHGGDDNVVIEAGSNSVRVEDTWCIAGHGISCLSFSRPHPSSSSPLSPRLIPPSTPFTVLPPLSPLTSIGSLGDMGSTACVQNVVIKNVVLMALSNGLRIKTYQGGSGSVSNVSYRNVYMVNVRRPIVIDQHYCDRNSVSHCEESSQHAVAISNVSYSRIIGTTDYTEGLYLNCSSTVPCRGITLKDINITSSASPRTPLRPKIAHVFGGIRSVVAPRLLPQQIPMGPVPFQELVAAQRMASLCR
ncbi:unnamed protein product [Closterium sp. Naga37s-1]|nr:unnamed protein product [Closterium sp. Naga37s-1]